MFTIASNVTSHYLLTIERRYTYCGSLKQKGVIIFTDYSSTARNDKMYEDDMLSTNPYIMKNMIEYDSRMCFVNVLWTTCTCRPNRRQ